MVEKLPQLRRCPNGFVCICYPWRCYKFRNISLNFTPFQRSIQGRVEHIMDMQDTAVAQTIRPYLELLVKVL